jgi:triphosphatase
LLHSGDRSSTVESWIVIPVVAGSNPVGHPNLAPQAAFRAAAEAALAQIEMNARGALLSEDPEFLHQLRVGLRRLRAALRAFRRILPRKEAKRLVRALRRLSPKLGTARDWDVLVARLEADGGSEALLRKAQARRATARRAARRAIVSKRFAGIGPAVRGLAAAESRETLAQSGAAALDRAHRKLMAQADGADWIDAAARHAVRIRVKRLRYSG